VTTYKTKYIPGNLIRIRDRDWVILSREDYSVLRVKPIDGSDEESIGLFLPFEEKNISESKYSPPDANNSGDLTGALLLKDAVRLTLRAGAGPFRSIGRISINPRPYQIVPLIMALRLDPIRMLIADDVGIGKTIILNQARTRQEQYEYLKKHIDPVSSLETDFLDYLYNANIKLPDYAQYRPIEEIYIQPDFYYERGGVPGICVFVDGPSHDSDEVKKQDTILRKQLEDKGYRVIVIRYDKDFESQIKMHLDVLEEQ
jgi:hypothetical protein